MINCWNHPHGQSQSLILKIFGNIKKVLYQLDLECCDLPLKLLSNSTSVGLILKNFPTTYQQNSQHKVWTLRLPSYASYMQGPHIYSLSWAPWILSAGLDFLPGLILVNIASCRDFWARAESFLMSARRLCNVRITSLTDTFVERVTEKESFMKYVIDLRYWFAALLSKRYTS